MKKKRAYLNSDIKNIDSMSGVDFEEYLSEHFKKMGYSVKLTPKSNDYGADLVLEKKGVRTVVQAKRHRGKVTNSAIQEIVTAKAYYNAHNAMVVINSFFTKNARELARANEVELWDRDVLISRFSISH